MQIKTRSTLPTGAFFMQVVVLLDLVVLVCVLTIMTSRVGMAYGYEVKAPSSRFLMNIVGDVEFISVTAGDQPAFYIGNRLIEGGLPRRFRRIGPDFPGERGGWRGTRGDCLGGWIPPFLGLWNSSWWIWCLPRE